MPASAPRAQVERLRAVLERARVERRTLTYLEAADAVMIEPPHRIHKLARLVEIVLKQDVDAGRTPLAALVVSRARDGLPAPGFFDRAGRLGIFDGGDPSTFHRALLKELFDDTEAIE
ncbi:MAG: hypothetical protein RQ847_02620 [Wenzhouxiangellaceae bacterium]|nr:hypothetical protein [Wenzhouxiangellaceae bacterium]